MPQTVSARWLAPLALLGALIAVIVTIAAAGGSSDNASVGAGSAPVSTTTARTATQRTTTTAKPSGQRSYTVQPGDVLGAIADKTGVPLSRIEQLNPTVDAQSLHAGQKLKLAP